LPKFICLSQWLSTVYVGLEYFTRIAWVKNLCQDFCWTGTGKKVWWCPL